MTRIATLVLLLATVAGAERQLAEFRLKKDVAAPMRGWILEYDDEGFTFERFGQGSRTRIRWSDLVDEDATQLRIDFKLELTEDEKKGLIPGHEIQFKGGGAARGILVGVDEDGTHRLRTEGLVLPYPGERVGRVVETKIKEEEAYSPDEIYIRRLERRPPQTATEHRRLGDYLFDIGNWDGAQEQYFAAIGSDPMLRPELEPRLAELKDILEDRAAADTFARHKGNAVLHGKWREGIEAIRAYTQENPGARRRGERLIGEMEEMWLEQKQARFHRVKHEEFDRSVRRYLARNKPDFETAKSWAIAQLPEEVKDRVRRRLDLNNDEMDMFLASKPKGSPHWASYWTGSFVVNDRVPKGKSTAKSVRGDPDRWWSTYEDVGVRANWIKAFVAERVGLFEVVQVNMHDCDRCGGSGQVTKWSPTALADGRHEWQEVCPRCFGAQKDRGIGYR